LEDPERYQTVAAKHEGSAAAPTAGLHFTQEILSTLTAKGIQIAEITLHVGIDTFRPIQVNDVSNHVMHGEVCEITPEVAQTINQAKGRIIAVGTTAVRTLETFASGSRKVNSGRTESRLFIHPGFSFQVIDGMFTNFHLPKTTMMLMISALSTREYILNAYETAVNERYRFLSFGDSMLILD
jgi:S-adenosylmethionine:tRNA ribosyltransferase-isomerase